MTNHRPEPKQHPGLVVVGDYLFDSTLNGLLDSSDAATDIIVTEMMRLRRARGERRQAGSRTRSTATISRITAGSAPTAKSGASSPIPPT